MIGVYSCCYYCDVVCRLSAQLMAKVANGCNQNGIDFPILLFEIMHELVQVSFITCRIVLN